MAPYKLEDNFREKLQEREIKPSPNAWRKLEAQLPSEEGRTNTFLWVTVAASIISILVIGSLLFTQTSNEDPQFVNNESQESETEKRSDETVVINSDKEFMDSENVLRTPLTNENTVLNRTRSANEPYDKKIKAAKNQKSLVTNQAIGQSKEESNPTRNKTFGQDQNEEFINAKIKEVVSNVEQLNSINGVVDIDEIDLLLKNAQTEIETKRLRAERISNIDPDALLKNVENELERSFRDRVFDALGDSYNIIRTAVAERNQ